MFRYHLAKDALQRILGLSSRGPLSVTCLHYKSHSHITKRSGSIARYYSPTMATLGAPSKKHQVTIIGSGNWSAHPPILLIVFIIYGDLSVRN